MTGMSTISTTLLDTRPCDPVKPLLIDMIKWLRVRPELSIFIKNHRDCDVNWRQEQNDSDN